MPKDIDGTTVFGEAIVFSLDLIGTASTALTSVTDAGTDGITTIIAGTATRKCIEFPTAIGSTKQKLYEALR